MDEPSAAVVTRAAARRPSPRTVRIVSFWLLVLAYGVLTLLVIYKSPLIRLDGYLAGHDLGVKRSGFGRVVETYVMFGQRGPATLTFLPVFLWVAWRTRSPRPLLLLVTSLVVLNVSVGLVKIAIGRIGPAHTYDAHLLFAQSGDIYPSGHVSNAVVLYGLLPWVVPQLRRVLVGFAIWMSLSVGIGTVYIRTHWFSDVLGGWIAGGLVLLALPTCMPMAEDAFDNLLAWHRERRRRRRDRASAGRHAPPPRRVPRPASGYARPNTAYPRPGYGHTTPVRPTARSHSLAATTTSFDARDEPTRRH